MHHHVMRSRCGDPPVGSGVPPLLRLVCRLSLLSCLGSADFALDYQFCADPGLVEHGNRTPGSGLFFENAVVRFSCLEGYKLRGPAKFVCIRLQNGSMGWKPNLQMACVADVTDCLIPYIEDADISNQTYRPGDKLLISCHEGFQIRYPDMDNMVSVCQADGSWDSLPICRGCLRPVISPHSYINISETEFSVPVGTIVRYQCFPGYKLSGPEVLECMYNLIWSENPPRCLDVEVCPLPPMVEHGDYICHPQPCDRYIHGTVVEFYCDPGYNLASDFKYITCQYGQWFPSIQVYCLRSEQLWPSSRETLLTTWKVVAFTATSVLMLLLFVILGKVFQTKFKAHCQLREAPPASSDPNVLVVDGVPVMLPSYDEAVNSSTIVHPSFPPPAGQGETLHSEDRGPPAYPGHVENSRVGQLDASEYETCESLSNSSDHLQSMCPSSTYPGGLNNLSERTNVITSTADTASTSPSIDIADEIPLVEEDC
ncbi:sushi domain-containing protein 4 isoform X1 [Polypterus senegalus]|uniref:sushi domain-containing protein 4 isoform X1 n=1 Tax=Polypterus senegalus TaxID=55291 RepID=UPI0019654297|nr:sushi domain-containing protein 4 isoform X1 [Polypterus senegalus]XP_039594272.1 sushi domain-containing protein 4 isoform X1 [Polypterus senegalus]